MAALSAGGPADPGTTHATASECLDQIMWLIEDSQLLKADELLTELQARGDVDAVAERLEEHKTRMDKLRVQAEHCHVAKAEFDQETGWQRVQTLLGITTYFKMVEGERNVWVKMEGEMEDVPLVCLAAVIREIDLYKTWLPFCSRSDILRWKSRAWVLAHFAIKLPLLFRDAVIDAFSCDTTFEDGSFMIMGSSTPEGEQTFEGDPIPNLDRSWSTSWGSSDRMNVKGFKAQFTQINPTLVRTRVVACVDPKSFLPDAVLNFCIRRIAGVVMVILASAARKIVQNPSTSEHAARIRSDEFYANWLIPKCDRFYDSQGWERLDPLDPKGVAAGNGAAEENLDAAINAALASGGGEAEGVVGETQQTSNQLGNQNIN